MSSRIWRVGVGRLLRLLWREPRKAMAAVGLVLWFLGWLVVFSLLTRFLPLMRSIALVAPRVRGEACGGGLITPAGAARLLDRLLALDCWFVKPTCWKRATLLYRYLVLRGLAVRIAFGVKREGESILGHAWLELDGQPFLEVIPPDYQVELLYPQ